MRKNLIVRKYMTTEFDFQFNEILNKLCDMNINISEQIQLLEQCIDYLRLEEAELNNEIK